MIKLILSIWGLSSGSIKNFNEKKKIHFFVENINFSKIIQIYKNPNLLLNYYITINVNNFNERKKFQFLQTKIGIFPYVKTN
jgi:pantothenate kinase